MWGNQPPDSEHFFTRLFSSIVSSLQVAEFPRASDGMRGSLLAGMQMGCISHWESHFMKFLAVAVLTLMVAAALPASANSVNYTWNFATAPNQSLGTSTYAYTANGITITATSGTNLFYKVGGGDETGLGLDNCPRQSCDHEIEPGEAITVNLNSLFSKNVTGISLMLGSIQPGETGSVCDAFGVCMTFTSSNDFKSTSILSLYADMKVHNSGSLIITAGSGDVLVNQLQVTTSTVPEPSSWLLMGSGLLGMAGMIRRKLGC
jgi:PEP-CTERM motif